MTKELRNESKNNEIIEPIGPIDQFLMLIASITFAAISWVLVIIIVTNRPL